MEITKWLKGGLRPEVQQRERVFVLVEPTAVRRIRYRPSGGGDEAENLVRPVIEQGVDAGRVSARGQRLAHKIVHQ